MLGRVCLIVATVINAAPCCFAITQTTTTTYQYNADGALTAVTTQVDSQTPSTAYFTWDDFVPSTADPSTGDVLAGNGNLIGFGPTPGSAFTTQFTYDPRNRLTSEGGGTQSVAYTYYPASLMASSTLSGGDALQFYYDVRSTPQVANISQASTTTWSAYLGSMTYLSDGTEQMRCQPRKDVAGIYTPAQQSFVAQDYDPYGASASGETNAAAESAYDMQQDPFQYAGEYQDPTWGGYYLRARWYLPPYQTFLTRDPGDALHRFSYGGGNPVGHVDPTGLHDTYGDFSRSVNRFLRPVNRGLRGELLPLLPVYGQVVGGIQLLGNLPEVWHHPNFRTWASFSFLVASVATEAGDSLPVFDRASGPIKAFGGRIAADVLIGVGQTALVADRGHGKLDVPALVQSISYNASGVLWGRLAAGFGYRSHPLSADDVNDIVTRGLSNGVSNDTLVFKIRTPVPSSGSASIGISEWNATLPALDLKRVGLFHESLFAVSQTSFLFTEIGNDGDGIGVTAQWDRLRRVAVQRYPTATSFLGNVDDARFEYVGRFPQRDVESAIANELLPAQRSTYTRQYSGRLRVLIDDYDIRSNNCQDHVADVLDNIRNP